MSAPKMSVTVNFMGLPVVKSLVRILKAALAELPAARRAMYLRDIEAALAEARAVRPRRSHRGTGEHA